MDTHTHTPTNLPSNPNGLATTTTVRNRLQTRIATGGHPWKQLLATASAAVVDDVCVTLQAYTLLWTLPPTTTTSETEIVSRRGLGSSPSQHQHEVVASALEVEQLFEAAEHDLEQGLSFIREVEKGSHMREDAVRGFRVEAIGVLCALCRERVGMLRPPQPRRGREGVGDDDEREDGGDEGGEGEGGEGEGGEEAEGALEAVRELIGTVYQGVETQLKSRFQALVHQHKTKARRK